MNRTYNVNIKVNNTILKSFIIFNLVYIIEKSSVCENRSENNLEICYTSYYIIIHTLYTSTKNQYALKLKLIISSQNIEKKIPTKN